MVEDLRTRAGGKRWPRVTLSVAVVAVLSIGIAVAASPITQTGDASLNTFLQLDASEDLPADSSCTPAITAAMSLPLFAFSTDRRPRSPQSFAP